MLALPSARATVALAFLACGLGWGILALAEAYATTHGEAAQYTLTVANVLARRWQQSRTEPLPELIFAALFLAPAFAVWLLQRTMLPRHAVLFCLAALLLMDLGALGSHSTYRDTCPDCELPLMLHLAFGGIVVPLSVATLCLQWLLRRRTTAR